MPHLHAARQARSLLAALLLSFTAIVTPTSGAEYMTGIDWPEPRIVAPGKTDANPPSDAVVLFDGTDMSAWKNAESWKVADGAVTVGNGMVETKQTFGDCQVHIEWTAPTPPTGASQGRGNSGLFFGNYEMQILDSYDNETYFDGQAAAIYKQTPPMVNAMRPPGEWNVYEVVWTAPRFDDDGSLKSPAYVTALHNGVLVLNHFELLGDTPFNHPHAFHAHPLKLPIRLQDHSNPVRFRNIWVREVEPIVGKRVRAPYMRDGDREWTVKKDE